MGWITEADVEAYLGSQQPPVHPVDRAWLTQATVGGDAWAQRQRAVDGYADDPDLVPAPDVKVGTVMYAAALYRDRGAADGWAAFAEFPAAPPAGANLSRIRGLLGVPRPKAF